MGNEQMINLKLTQEEYNKLIVLILNEIQEARRKRNEATDETIIEKYIKQMYETKDLLTILETSKRFSTNN